MIRITVKTLVMFTALLTILAMLFIATGCPPSRDETVPPPLTEEP